MMALLDGLHEDLNEIIQKPYVGSWIKANRTMSWPRNRGGGLAYGTSRWSWTTVSQLKSHIL